MAELKRIAGYWTIVAITIGSVMGTGIFMGPAIGASISGNASIISWIILSAISIYISACFGELVAMFPKAGGVYEFGKQTYGRFMSFILGWTAWLVGNISTVLLIVAGVDYLLPGNEFTLVKIVISCIFLLLLNLVSLFGMEGSSAMVIVFTIITLATLFAVLFPGLFQIHPANYTPFFTAGLPSILVTIFFIAESYFGWEAASYLAEETKDPEKVIPKALVISTAFVSLIGLLMPIVMLGAIPSHLLAQSQTPLLDLAHVVYIGFGPVFQQRILDALSMGVYLTMIGCAAGTVITMPRLILALARDKLFLKQFSAIHPKFSTPYRAIYFQFGASIIILLIGFGQYETLLSLLVPMGFVMYAFVLMSVPILRIRKPELKREFKAPLGQILPLFIVIFFGVLVALWILNIPNSMSLLGVGASLILLGIPTYFLIGLYNDPKMITEINDLFAYVTLFTEGINIPKGVIREIMLHLGDMKGKDVLEFGCSVGTLTMKLAEAVGPRGMVYATSFSKNHIFITDRRIESQRWKSDTLIHGKVRLIHDIEHQLRIHPSVGRVDAAVSIGMIGYVQDIEKVLREIHALMPDGGKICFFEYGDFFHMIPNIDWMENNSKIEETFRHCGFSVKVVRKRGLFWNYVYIFGIKFSKDVPFI